MRFSDPLAFALVKNMSESWPSTQSRKQNALENIICNITFSILLIFDLPFKLL